MNITTRYSENQNVWVLDCGKSFSGKIQWVATHTENKKTIIQYAIQGSNECFNESELYPSRKALLKSL